jgi:hypothetical protein
VLRTLGGEIKTSEQESAAHVAADNSHLVIAAPQGSGNPQPRSLDTATWRKPVYQSLSTQ